MTRLLVPIHLSALVERVQGEVYADTKFKPVDRKVDKPTRQKILPDPFANLSEEGGTRQKGVYLHWALPDALARFDSKAKRFPPLPCRWVVIRSSGTPEKRQVQAWLLADIHQPEVAVLDLSSSATIPEISGSADLNITGPDHADPSWFAYYDNTYRRLSFYDSCSGITSGPLSYLVCGWHVRTHYDPLHNGSQPLSEAGLYTRLAELGWNVKSVDGVLNTLPSATLYHGAAVAIGWPNPGWPGDGGGDLVPEEDMRPDPSSLTIVLGDRTSAAIAELFTGNNATAEQLIELLVGGEIRDLSQVNGAHLAAVNAHRGAFKAATRPSTTSEIIYVPEIISEPTPAPSRLHPLDASRPEQGGLLYASAQAHDGVVRPFQPDPFSRATSDAPQGVRSSSSNWKKPDTDPGEFDRVHRPEPRTYLPNDPMLVLLGAGRTYRHGEDGRFDALGTLPCRVSGDTVSLLGRPGQTDGGGRDLLPHKSATELNLPTSVLDKDIASDIEALLIEVHALDPAMNPSVTGSTTIDPLAELRAEWLVAKARDAVPGSDPSDPLPVVRTDGVYPAPLSITLPERPWNPLHLDWSVEWTPSRRALHDWVLDDIDFEPASSAASDATSLLIKGQAILTASPAKELRDAIQATIDSLGRQPNAQDVIDQILAAFSATDVTNLIFQFAHTDLVSAPLAGFVDRLRGIPEGTWIGKSGIIGSSSVIRNAEKEETYTAELVIAGTFTLGQLRLVDTFGRKLDLLPGAPPARICQSLQHPENPAVALQRPRFTAPATIDFRYIRSTAVGDLSKADVDTGQIPLIGLLTPNPFDGSLEVHSVEGQSLGQLRLGHNGRALWEASPGTAAVVGAPPAQAIGTRNPAEQILSALIEGIVRSDENRSAASLQDSALAILLRAVDTTRFTIDLTAKAGMQHLQALLGSPIAILRARVRISLDDPQADPARPVTIPIRLGSIGNVHDGLFCFYLTDQVDRLHLIHPALASAELLALRGRAADDIGSESITDAHADTSGIVWIDAGRDLDILLLVAPGADVSLTSGLAPGKVLEMQREWLDKPISQLTPTLRFDAVLRNPQAARFPTATDVQGDWKWHHHVSPTEWKSELVMQPADGQLDPARPAVVEDGYLRVDLKPDPPYNSVMLKIVAVRRLGVSQTIQKIRVESRSGKMTDFTRDEAVAMALSGRFSFFTQVEGYPQVNVIVDETDRGTKFLRTEGDQVPGNNLYSLPPF